jgi:alkyl hydroperoxide reductase subunit AhpC
MIELGQLEAQHEEFARRNVEVVVISVEDQKDAQLTQKEFPHLVVVADKERNLAKAVEVLQPGSDPHGDDTSAPTTILVDGSGTVRWVHRPPTVIGRLSPGEVVKAIDEKMPAK